MEGKSLEVRQYVVKGIFNGNIGTYVSQLFSLIQAIIFFLVSSQENMIQYVVQNHS